MSPELALLVLKLLDIVSAGLSLAPELERRKNQYIDQIEVMITEDRGPSNDEMDALLAESAALTDAIRAERDRRAE